MKKLIRILWNDMTISYTLWKLKRVKSKINNLKLLETNLHEKSLEYEYIKTGVMSWEYRRILANKNFDQFNKTWKESCDGRCVRISIVDEKDFEYLKHNYGE